MLRTRLAAALLAGSLLTSSGCMGGMFGGNTNDGCNTGHCGHGGGMFGRWWGSGSPTTVAAPVVPTYGGSYGGYVGGADCPCSYKTGGDIFQPAVLPQGVMAPSIGTLPSGGMPPGAIPSGAFPPGAMAGPISGGMEHGPVTTLPPQASTTPSLPPGAYPTAPPSTMQPGAIPPGSLPSPMPAQPRIEPIPAAPVRPMSTTGVAPSGGFAQPAPWGPQ